MAERESTKGTSADEQDREVARAGQDLDHTADELAERGDALEHDIDQTRQDYERKLADSNTAGFPHPEESDQSDESSSAAPS